jgi:hypothetical protein
MDNPQAKQFISNFQTVNLPSGIPPEITSPILADIVRRYAIPVTQASVEVVITAGTIESSKMSYISNLTCSITHYRNTNMALDYSPTLYASGWRKQQDA